MKDIRLSLGFWDHWKTVSLEAELGFEAVKSLQILWCFAAQNKPSGVLCGMTKKAIAIAARFHGDRELFVDTLVDLRFIEFDGQVYSLHDWEDHNGYAATADQRSEAARKAANAKWEKKRGVKTVDTERNAESCGTQCESHENANAERNAECNPPSPSPSPSPKESKSKTKFSPPSLDEVTEYCEQRGNGVDPVKWHAFYASKNWMIGRNKMADWKQAVITWESRTRDNPQKPIIPCPTCQFSDSPICAKKPDEKRIACPSFREKAA